MFTQVLYSLITFGVTWDAESAYDPPAQTLRLRLVCTIIDTCGQFFNSGSSKKRLDCFLSYFQMYFQFKKLLSGDEFPWQIDHLVKESILDIRPKATIFKDYQSACEAVAKLNRQIMDKAVTLLPELKDQDGLDSIPEEGTGPTDQEASLGPGTEDEDPNDLFVESDQEEEDRRPERLEEANQEFEEEGLSQSQSQIADSEEENCPPLFETNVDLKLPTVQCPEDDDFLSEFDRMVSDNLLERTREAPTKLDRWV